MKIVASRNQFARENRIEQFQEIIPVLDVMSDGVHVIGEDIVRSSAEAFQYKQEIENLTKDFSILKTTVQSQNNIFDQLENNTFGQNIELMKQNLIRTKFVSNDGTFLWQISTFNDRLGKFFVF